MAKDHNFDNFDWLERGCGRNDLLDSISQSVNQFSMDSWRMDTPIPRQYPQYPLQDAPTGYGYGHGLGVSYQEDSVMSTPAYTGPIDFQSISTSMPQNGPDSMQSPMFLPPTAATRPNRRPQKDGWTKDEDNLLLTLRKEGWEYSQIAEEMRTKLGVNRTENCLVKRLQKIQVQYLEPLPKAVKNAMPQIITSINDQFAMMGFDAAGKDKEVMDQIMLELPRVFPKFIQNQMMSKRKALLNTSLARN